MITLRRVKGRVNPRAAPRRRRPRPKPLTGFTARERRTEFRLHGPFYYFDTYKGPCVREWDGEDHVVVFQGDPEQCQAYLDYRISMEEASDGKHVRG